MAGELQGAQRSVEDRLEGRLRAYHPSRDREGVLEELGHALVEDAQLMTAFVAEAAEAASQTARGRRGG